MQEALFSAIQVGDRGAVERLLDQYPQLRDAMRAGDKGETPGSQGKSADLLQRVNNCLTELAAAGSTTQKPH